MGRGAVPLGPPAFKKVPGLRGRARGIMCDKISSDFLNQKIKHIVRKTARVKIACMERVTIATSNI